MVDKVTSEERLQAFCQRGCDFLGTRYSILGGAMSWVSERHLVSAISNAGGFGVLACGAMEPERLDEEIKATRALTKFPFGVNLITMHPKLEALIDVCLENNVSHIVLAGGLPREKVIKRIRDANVKVMVFAPTLALAKRLVRSGAQAIVIEGSEAGGHVGPVSLNVLAQEILPHLEDVPVFVAGGIGRGEAMLAYLEQGAAGVQLGTLFAASKESIAHENFKQSFLRANARDAVVTSQLDERFPVIPVRAIENDASKKFMKHQAQVIESYQDGKTSLKEAQLEIEHFWAGSLRKAVIEGDIENGSLMAGQSVGLVKELLSVEEIIGTLRDQALKAIEKKKHS
ncbi:enoyl-acp reductase [Lasius niger]|uniref:Enoyl-acp reductase n=1 Tax=Lasius niger TaxID=67767 RepID=A0A0J7KBX0_LASNI|nr:enoyl-acp reductase [Lasius niger]